MSEQNSENYSITFGYLRFGYAFKWIVLTCANTWVLRVVPRGKEMCRWMHSLRCFWEMGPWLCVSSLHRGKHSAKQRKQQKKSKVRRLWYTTRAFLYCFCYLVHTHTHYYIESNWTVGITTKKSGLQNVACVLLSIMISIFSSACAFVCWDSRLTQMQSTVWFPLLSLVFVLYSSQQEQTQTKRFCK